MTDENQDVELHDETEEDIVEMKHDGEDAEKELTAQAAPRGAADQMGTKTPMPKTKAGLMAGLMTQMQGMNREQLKAMYNMKADYHMAKEGTKEEVQSDDIAYTANFEEDLNALVSEEATLSDEFKDKASTIFEAAIKSKLSTEIDRLEEKYNEELAEEVASTKSDLVEKVDSYLNYVVEKWIEDNKVAVHSTLRTEIAEKFMNNLKGLFVESYIDVPESKVDLVDELAAEVSELEGAVNTSTSKIIEMTEELETYKRNEIISEASKDLAETQKEKLASLVADIDFGDNFAEKVATVKESYFKKQAVDNTTEEDKLEETFEVEAGDSMGQYLSAIKRQNKS